MRVTGSLQVKRGIYQMMTRVIFDDGTVKQKSKSTGLRENRPWDATSKSIFLAIAGTPEGTRTPNPQNRNQESGNFMPFYFLSGRHLHDEIWG